jgi:hypothetical protein
MATTKTYTVAGVSKLNGDYKIRFANDVMRVKNLAKSGHEDIRLVELADAMLKTEAAKFIATLSEFSDADAQTAIAEYLDKHDQAPKVEVKRAVKAAVTKKPAKAAAPKSKVDTSALEDAPF